MTVVLAAPDKAIDVAGLRNAAQVVCSLLKVLANPDRLMLLCQLTEGERHVSELSALTGILQPTLSQQLGVLREEGLVVTRRDGKQIFYGLASQDVLYLLQVLQQRFCHNKPHTN